MLPRLHFVDGRCRVLLHDVESGDVVELGPREWVLLACADGTRDVEGIRLAGAREGARVSDEALGELLGSLHDAGMLEEGPAPRRRHEDDSGPATGSSGAREGAAPHGRERAARPIERLEGYSFTCDGHGSCCKLYATIVFSPLEAARARSVLPDVLDGGERHEHVFMPERGAGPCPGSAVALVEGHCAYLDGHLCALHRAAGAQAKPIGCNLFPLALVDDGSRVRASMSVECACVLASLGKEGGEALLPESARVRGDLDPAIVVDELPAEVAVTAGSREPLARYLEWSDAALAALPAGDDAAVTAWSLAEAVAAHGLDPGRARAAVEAPSPVGAALSGRYLAALAAKAARRAKAQNAWRGERDLCRRGVSVVAAAAELLADEDVRAAVAAGAGAAAADEAFYLRVALFGHQMVGYPLAVALRDRATAIWVARVFPLAAAALYPGDEEPAFEHPIALVEALLRGHGLRRYTEDLGPEASCE